MASAWVDKGSDEDPNHNQNQRDVTTQLVISIALGLIAFLSFCVRISLPPPALRQKTFEACINPDQALRPRWTGLYAARKRQKNSANALPDLPDSLFGWLPVLYKITEEEVLGSAGLDAFVVCSHTKVP